MTWACVPDCCSKLRPPHHVGAGLGDGDAGSGVGTSHIPPTRRSLTPAAARSSPLTHARTTNLGNPFQANAGT